MKQQKVKSKIMEPNKYEKIISFLENKMKDCDSSILVINKNELKNMFDELNVNAKDYKKWILDYLQDGLLTADDQTMSEIKNAINWLKSINDPAAVHEEETHKDFSQFKPKFQVGDKVNLIDRPDVKYNILIIESVNMDEHCYVCNQGSVIDFSEEIIWRKVENDDTKPTRFNVGDFVVVRNGKCTKILKIEQADSADYKCMNMSDGSIETIHVENLDDADSWVWSIKDAKPGDVLITNSNAIIFIYKSHVENDLVSGYCRELVSGYCRYYTDENVFYENYCDRICNVDEVHPATKEQCNMLFDAMDAAGYEWIPETKTLRQTNFKQGEWYQCIEDVMINFINFDAGTAYFCSGEERLEAEDGNHVWIPENSYSNFKLWSISDAKDGDVLASSSEIFIYSTHPNNRIDSYCHLIGNRFIAGRGIHVGKIKPASKEQKALLFDKMKLDGYEWNETDKTLKKTDVGDFCRKKCHASQECGGIFSDENKNESNEGWSENDVKIIRGLGDFVIASMPLEKQPLVYMKWLNRLMDKILKDENIQSNELSKSDSNEYNEGWSENDVKIIRGLADFVVASMPLEEQPLLYMKWLNKVMDKILKDENAQSNELSKSDSNKEKLIESIKSMIAESVNTAKSNDEGEPLDRNTSVQFAYGRASGLEDALVAINKFLDN